MKAQPKLKRNADVVTLNAVIEEYFCPFCSLFLKKEQQLETNTKFNAPSPHEGLL